MTHGTCALCGAVFTTEVGIKLHHQISHTDIDVAMLQSTMLADNLDRKDKSRND